MFWILFLYIICSTLFWNVCVKKLQSYQTKASAPQIVARCGSNLKISYFPIDTSRGKFRFGKTWLTSLNSSFLILPDHLSLFWYLLLSSSFDFYSKPCFSIFYSGKRLVATSRWFFLYFYITVDVFVVVLDTNRL